MLKTLKSTESEAQPDKGGVGVGRSRAERDSSGPDGSGIEDGGIDGGEVEDNKVGRKGQKTSKSKKTIGLDFFTSGARLAFIKLKQAFIKASILHHFYPERHIRIETDASGYAIREILT